MSKLIDEVALAIKKADSSLFNENYTRQAGAALKAIRSAGYEIIVRRPSDEMIEEVAEEIPFGRLNKYDFLREIYRVFIDTAKKY